MITSTFLSIFYVVVSFFVGLLPNASESSSFGSAITSASSYISGAYGIVPLITIAILSILSFDVVFEGSYLFYKSVMWVIKRLPTQS